MSLAEQNVAQAAALNNAPVTPGYVIEDYLAHLHHHLQQAQVIYST